MQEQVPSNITPEQGWSQMKAILDREMPAQRKSRRMITWWRSLMAVGLLTALSLTVYNTMQQDDQQNKLQQNQPATPPVKEQPTAPAPAEEKTAAQQENTFAANTQGTDDDQQGVNNVSTNSSTTIASSTRTSATRNAESIAQNSTAKTSVQGQPSAKSDNGTLLGHHSSLANTIERHAAETSTAMAASHDDKTTLNTDQPVNAGSHADREEGYPATSFDQEQTPGELSNAIAFDDETPSTMYNAQRNGQVTDAIPGLSLEALPIEDRIAMEVDWSNVNPVAGMMPVKRKGRMLEGYVAGSGMAGFRKGGAWQAGAGMSVCVMPKVRLSGGASYREYSPDFSFENLAVTKQEDAADLPIVNLDPLVNEGGFVNDYVLNAGTTYESLEPLVKTLRQWQVDASITCDIGKRWFIQGGASYAMSTSAISTYPILEDAYLSNPYELRFTNDLDNYEVLREHMVTLHGGVGYHLGRHWDLYVQADHGLQPYLLTDTSLSSGSPSESDRKDYIRGLTLGVRYRVL